MSENHDDIGPCSIEERELLVKKWGKTPVSKLPHDVWLKIIMDMPQPTDDSST